MSGPDFVQELMAVSDPLEQQRFLQERITTLDSESINILAESLKEEVIQLQQANIEQALQVAGLIGYLGDLSGNPLHHALGLRMEAQARLIGLGEYKQSLSLYDKATAIHQEYGDLLGEALVQVTRIWALAALGRYDEAFAAGKWANEILTEHEQWRNRASLNNNLAAIYGRRGEENKALAKLDVAREAYQQLGAEGELFLVMNELSRAIVLRNLGRFEESITAAQKATAVANRFNQPAAAARAQQNLATTYFVLGRYNEALKLLDDARTIFLSDGRRRDAILVELFISDCLLQLRRFGDVLDKCRQVRTLFTELGTRFEVAQSLLNEAVAYAGLEEYGPAQASLREARQLFADEGTETWMAMADLELAAILLRQGAPERSLEMALACTAVFQEHGLVLEGLQAGLIASRAAQALEQYEQARQLLAEVLAVAGNQDIPALTYQCYHLLGQLRDTEGDRSGALVAYDQAISELERLRGRLMVEFRAGFLEDKQVVYEDAVWLCLELDQPAHGLEYVERAKSRALLDLLAFRLSLDVEARDQADQPLVEALVRLRAERDRLYRGRESRGEARERGQTTAGEGQQRFQQEVLSLEKQITDLWHQLLIRNADYARDAALWQVHTEPFQPYLDGETLLLEYFVAHGKVIAFLATRDAVEVRRLPGALGQVQNLLQLFWLNLRAVPGSNPDRLAGFVTNARGLLGRLHTLLLAPLAGAIAPYKRLIIVPHGSLHYLPFHALYDGRRYLLQDHEISYLPGASFLRYFAGVTSTASAVLVAGHSYGGRLPQTIEEAEAIASLWHGEAALEEEATVARIKELSAQCRLIHLAAHGDFRPDNPLFSGLALADGWLTTLDIFALHLQASLVTLSACQTGRSVVAGGDELLGLMRAFLKAGANSLVASLWAVEDRSTTWLMRIFYEKLAAGWTKGAALRYAQLHLSGTVSGRGSGQQDSQNGPDQTLSHPYFWAPFILVGDTGHY